MSADLFLYAEAKTVSCDQAWLCKAYSLATGVVTVMACYQGFGAL